MFIFLVVIFKKLSRRGLAMWPSLDLNLRSSGLSLPSVGITGMFKDACPVVLILIILTTCVAESHDIHLLGLDYFTEHNVLVAH